MTYLPMAFLCLMLLAGAPAYAIPSCSIAMYSDKTNGTTEDTVTDTDPDTPLKATMTNWVEEYDALGEWSKGAMTPTDYLAFCYDDSTGSESVHVHVSGELSVDSSTTSWALYYTVLNNVTNGSSTCIDSPLNTVGSYSYEMRAAAEGFQSFLEADFTLDDGKCFCVLAQSQGAATHTLIDGTIYIEEMQCE